MQFPSHQSLYRRFAILAVAAAFAVAGGPVAAVDMPPLRAQEPPVFLVDLAVSIDSLGSPGLSVALTLPYGELQWEKIPGGFGASAEITVVFEPRSGPGQGASWQRQLFVDSFERTNSTSIAVAEKRTFRLRPGRYDTRIEVRDLSSGLASRVRETLNVPDYSREPLGFADLEMGAVDDSGRFTAVSTRVFGRNVERLAARATVFDRRPGNWPRIYPLRFRILDDAGQEVLAGMRQVEVTRSAEPVVVRPDSTPLFLGRYTFEVQLEEGRSRWRVDRSFEVEESGPPRGREFERMLEPLSYIATSEEIDTLKGLQPEEQAAGWEAFWKKRDPTPDTPRNEAMLEFFRRVRYVDQHFQHFGPGWRSDMGRIYIKFGPPDQVDTRPSTTQSPQVEIWYYNRPYRRFVFVDREGFGRYTLVYPVSE